MDKSASRRGPAVQGSDAATLGAPGIRDVAIFCGAAAIERELRRWGWEPPTESMLTLCAARCVEAYESAMEDVEPLEPEAAGPTGTEGPHKPEVAETPAVRGEDRT